MESRSNSQKSAIDDLRQLSIYIDNVNRSIRNIDIHLNNANANKSTSCHNKLIRSFEVINEKEDNCDSFLSKNFKGKNPFIRRYKMKKKFSTVITPLDIPKRLFSSEITKENSVCSNNAPNSNTNNSSINIQKAISVQEEPEDKEEKEVNEVKDSNSIDVIHNNNNNNISNKKNNSSHKKKPIKLLFNNQSKNGNNILKKLNKTLTLGKKKSSRNIMLADVNPINNNNSLNNTLLTNTNNSLNNTYHTSVSQAKNKPSSLRIGSRAQKPFGTTFIGSYVNKNKMSNKTKEKTKSNLHNSYIGSSNYRQSSSNKHNIIVSSFNLSNKNDIKKMYMTTNTKNKQSLLSSRTKSNNSNQKEKIINFNKMIGYKAIQNNNLNDLLSIIHLINDLCLNTNSQKSCIKEKKNEIEIKSEEEYKIIYIQKKWRQYYIKKKIIKNYRIGTTNSSPKISKENDLLHFSKLELFNSLMSSDKNFKEMIKILNKMNECYLKCIKNKKFLEIKNIIQNKKNNIKEQASDIINYHLRHKKSQCK